MRIGLSYDQGTAKYPLYASTLIAAGEHFGYPLEAVWLAGPAAPRRTEGLDGIDGVVFTGGADVEPHRYGLDDAGNVCVTFPGRDEAEIPLLEEAIAREIPVLAICRGMQLLNVVCGGTLVPDLPGHDLDDAARHPVVVDPNSGLAAILGSTAVAVSSSHHQAVDRLGRGLRIAARSQDGIVEAIEWEDGQRLPWLAAVQWHPERMALDEPAGGNLYAAFLGAVATKRS
jgi:putative glutamine amidotransferase